MPGMAASLGRKEGNRPGFGGQFPITPFTGNNHSLKTSSLATHGGRVDVDTGQRRTVDNCYKFE